ncbi:MAG: hypothetical protein Q9162_002209 [Coniocarpon cinnabarinum]
MPSITAQVAALAKKLTTDADIVVNDVIALMHDVRTSSNQDFKVPNSQLRTLVEHLTLDRHETGLLLFDLAKRSEAVATSIITSLSDLFPLLGKLIKDDGPQDVKFVVGRLIQILFQHGVEEEAFFHHDHSGFESCTTSKIYGVTINGSPAQREAKAYELELTLQPAVFYVDAQATSSQWIKIGFRNSSEAKAALTDIQNAKQAPSAKGYFAISERILADPIPMDNDVEDELDDTRTSCKRPHDDDAASSDKGKLKSAPVGRLRKSARVSNVKDDENDIFEFNPTSKQQGHGKQSGKKVAPKLATATKQKQAPASKRRVKKSHKLLQPTGDITDEDVDDESRLSPLPAEPDSVTKKPQIVDFDENGPRNQPGAMRAAERAPLQASEEPRVDNDGFFIPLKPTKTTDLLRAVEPRQARGKHVSNDLPVSKTDSAVLSLALDAPLSKDDKDHKHGQDAEKSSFIGKSKLSANIFCTPPATETEGQDPLQHDSACEQHGSQLAPVIVSDDTTNSQTDEPLAHEFPMRQPKPIHRMLSKVLPGLGKAENAPLLHDQPYTADDVFRGDDLVPTSAQPQPRTSPGAEVRRVSPESSHGSSSRSESQEQSRHGSSPDRRPTGSQLSRRVTESGSPFPAQQKLPLDGERGSALLMQLRAVQPVQVPAQKPEETSNPGRWVAGDDEDETLVEEVAQVETESPGCNETNSNRLGQPIQTMKQSEPSTAGVRSKPRWSFVDHKSSSPSSSDQQEETPQSHATTADQADESMSYEVPAHHKGMMDALMRISRELLAQVEDQETAANAVTRAYADGGAKLLAEVTASHSRDAEDSIHRLSKARAALKQTIKNGIQTLEKSGKQTRAQVGNLTRHTAQAHEGLDDKLAIIDQMLKATEAQ